MRSRLAQFLRLLISFLLIFWLLSVVDLASIAASLSKANLYLVSLVMVLSNLDRILMAYKWHLLLVAKGIKITLFGVVGAYYKASFMGAFFLPSVGMDAIRIVEVSHRTKKTGEIISSVVIERFLGLVALGKVTLLSLTLFVFNVDVTAWKFLVFLLGALLLVSLLFYLSLRIGWMGSLLDRPGIAKWRITQGLRGILESYQDYSNHRQVLFLFFFLSVLEQFSPILDTFLIALALGLELPFLAFVMFVPVILLVTRLPVSFDGFGVREGMHVYLFGLIGVQQSDAFLLGLMTTMVARLGIVPVTLFFFLSGRGVSQPEKA
jgi:glycosyltransferase 2 family protein